jgi:hypothetical protein
MQAHYQITKFPGLGQSCDFSKLPLEERFEEGRLCKALHFWAD